MGGPLRDWINIVAAKAKGFGTRGIGTSKITNRSSANLTLIWKQTR